MPNDVIQINLRIDRDLRKQLQEAAAAGGRALNKEINERLSKSLAQESPDYSSPDLAGLLRIIGEAMDAAGESALFELTQSWDAANTRNWTDDPYAYAKAAEAAAGVIGAIAPGGTLQSPGIETPWDGKFWAEFVLKQAATGEGNVPEANAKASALHRSIGRMASRISHFGKHDPTENAKRRRGPVRPHKKPIANIISGKGRDQRASASAGGPRAARRTSHGSSTIATSTASDA